MKTKIAIVVLIWFNTGSDRKCRRRRRRVRGLESKVSRCLWSRHVTALWVVAFLIFVGKRGVILLVIVYPLVAGEMLVLLSLPITQFFFVMAIRLPNVKLNFLKISQSSWSAMKGRSLKPVNCAPTEVNQQQEVGIMCEPCGGKGWLLCDFCNGQKTNVKAPNKRIYRRCPSCRAIGYVLCSKCKVFKCVTFPDYSDCEPDNI